ASVGNITQARQAARAALAISQDAYTRQLAAIALARAGDSSGAQRQVDALNREHPAHTLLQHYSLPTTRAQIELNRAHARRALELLEPTKRFEPSHMYSAGIRGHAYLAAGDGAAAAAEFQKILDHRGLTLNGSIGALAHLYLGRARA